LFLLFGPSDTWCPKLGFKTANNKVWIAHYSLYLCVLSSIIWFQNNTNCLNIDEFTDIFIYLFRYVLNLRFYAHEPFRTLPFQLPTEWP
jgi:hypothetical protein